jgi:ABC-type antimicrobial peptide transport system permease subunit
MQSVRGEISAVDGQLVVFDMQTMKDVHRQAFWRQRTLGTAFGMFAILSLLLAVVGLYGVLSYMVVQRRREMGVRLALGADGTRIVRMVVTDGMRLVALGVGIGLPLALAVARLLQSRLVGVGYTDPVSLGSVLAIMIGVAMIASYVPAARAARTDPIRVLREQ